jgi:predicted nucleotidyltransferase
MVKGKTELDTIIKKYIDSMRNEIIINYAILFGSYAKGNPREESDIDIAIISENFGKNHLEELQFLSRKRKFSDSSIEAIPFSLEDFKNRDKGDLITEIYENGVIIESSD